MFFTLPIVFSVGGELSTTGSYLVSCICFFILTLISVYLILGKKYISYYVIAFTIQIIIGLVHYLVFVDSSYFSTAGGVSYNFWHEYNSTFTAIQELTEERGNSSLFNFESEVSVVHSEIWQIISIPFYFLGHKWMNYAPLNVFSSLLASVNMLFLFKIMKREKMTKREIIKKKRYLMFLTAYFPFFLLNDLFWRDPFGIALISIGLVLLTLGTTPITGFISLVFLGYASFIQRIMYLPIAGVAFIINHFKNTNNKVFKILMIPIFAILLVFLFNLANESKPEDYDSLYVNNMSVLALPLKIFFGLIGPFPWHRFPELAALNPAYSFQLTQYLQGIFQVGFLITIISNFKKCDFKNIDALTMMGFGIMLSGFISKQMHIGYIAEGLFFTLPWFYSRFSISSINKSIGISFLILFFLNFVTLITGHVGMSSMWK